jgi:hypothetical protein
VLAQDTAHSINPDPSLSKASGPLLPTLRQSTIEDMRKNIAFTTLSKTFQEAVQTSRHLGLHYIWIDSLCIIQDSVEDWQKESTTMCDVYHGSTINIAATASSNGAGGCFRSRAPDRVIPCEVRISKDNEGKDIWTTVQRNTWEDQVENAPLCRRAWVVQERILAPRTLHFGKTQMFWECNAMAACESIPDGKNCFPVKKTLYSVKTSVWHFIVEYYCKASLTHTSDKLVAIAGIAKFLHALDVTKYDEYYAGLWKAEMEKQMFWTVREGPIRTPVNARPATYRAPTWSWASVDGPVIFRHFNPTMSRMRISFRVIDTHVISSTEDKFGQVQSASLTLECYCLLKTACISWQVNNGKFELDGISVPSGLLRIDIQLEPEWQGSTIYLLTAAEAVDLTGKLKAFCCFLLSPTGKVNGEYQRIGIMDIPEYFDQSKHFQQAPDVKDGSMYQKMLEDKEIMGVITLI